MKNSTPSDTHLSAMFDVVATKLAPQFRRGYINRCELLHKINGMLEKKLTLVHSPPGYGKSSVLGQWLEQLRQQNVATAWLTLEEEESSANVFLIHIITACIRCGYLDEHVLAHLGRIDEKVSSSVIRTQFINALAHKTAPLVIFLDEYNRIQSEAVDHCLRMVLRHLPEHVHMVVASRWRPQLDIENLRIHDELIEVTASDLRFSEEEAFRLLDHQGSGNESEELLAFYRYTEGWPMAIQMLRLWLGKSRQRIDLIGRFATNTANMARYLTEQVLSDLPETEQDFLLQTSVIDRINGDLAQRLTGQSDSWLMLEKLYERNLFIVPLEQDRQWFSYHAIFQEYLQDMLAKRYPGKVSLLHEQAAHWYERNGDIRRAVEHAWKADKPELVATLLDNAGGWRMVMDGRIAIIQKALSYIPAAIIHTFPSLQLAIILGLIKSGKIDTAQSTFRQIREQHSRHWSDADLLDLEIIDNTLADYADEQVTAEEIEQIQSLKQRILPQDHLVQALLSDSLASKCYGLRRYQATHEACAEAASHYRILQSLYGEMFIRFKQMQVYQAQGRLAEALAIGQQNQQEIRLRLGDNAELAAHNRIFMAEIALEQGEADNASELLQDSLRTIERADGWFELYASAYHTASALAWREGGIEPVRQVLKQAHHVADARILKRLHTLANCEAVFYACLDGQINDIGPTLRQLEKDLHDNLLPEHFMQGRVALALALHRVSGPVDHKIEAFIHGYLDAALNAGDTRQVIGFQLLLAIYAYRNNAIHDAVNALNEALSAGLFSGFHFAYVKYAYWLLPLVNLVLKDDSLLPVDRYRNAFLAEIKRAMTEWEKARLQGAQAVTQAEIDVLQELVKGYSNKKIALQLNISPDTVKYRLKGLFTKFAVSKRTELVQLVRQQGLVTVV